MKIKKSKKKKKNPPLTRPRSSSVCPDRDLFESQPRREVSLCRMFKLPMWRLKKKKKKIKVQRASRRAEGVTSLSAVSLIPVSVWEWSGCVCVPVGRPSLVSPSLIPPPQSKSPATALQLHTHTHTPSSTKVSPSIPPHPLSPTSERRVTRLLCPRPLSSSPTLIPFNCCFLQARQLLLASHETKKQPKKKRKPEVKSEQKNSWASFCHEIVPEVMWRSTLSHFKFCSLAGQSP